MLNTTSSLPALAFAAMIALDPNAAFSSGNHVNTHDDGPVAPLTASQEMHSSHAQEQEELTSDQILEKYLDLIEG